MPLFSVIMPVYAVESYIKESVRSICNQTYKDFEIILVDDESPDRSIEYAEEVLRQEEVDYRILRQENSGVSVARNHGMREAKGKWILCVDPDDMLHCNTLKLAKKIIDKNSEIDTLFLNYRVLKLGDSYSLNHTISEDYALYEKDELSTLFLNRRLKLIAPGTIINRDAVNKWNLSYDENVRYSEDQLYLWKLLRNDIKAAVIRENLYYYLLRPQSTMRSSGLDKILSGYEAFVKLQQKIDAGEITYGPCGKLVLSRWVFGVLHSSAKYLNFRAFVLLTDRLCYKQHFRLLLEGMDIKIKILAFIGIKNVHLFWNIAKRI